MRLVTARVAPLDTTVLAREFPTVSVDVSDACGVLDPIIECSAWTAQADFRAADEACESSSSSAVTVRGAAEQVVAVACEILTRFQRHVRRRNAASDTPLFDAVLRAHASLHDCDKPLVRADYDHALDTWQWLLRLDPDASLALQLAALFHDVERLESEADRRVEHHAPDYQAFKDAHAAKGADRAFEVLRAAGVDATTASQVRRVVGSHERRGRGREIDRLNDADALSFFSLNSAGYADYFGPEQTRRKVAYTLSRLSRPARAKLAYARLRPDVHHFLLESEAA